MFKNGDVFGNTPMIKINYKYNGKINNVYVKLEFFSLTGSIKDRVAYYMINNAKKRGKLRNGMPIIEATSGNTGIALAALGSYYNHPVKIFMPDWASQERVNIMKKYGAEVYLFSKEEGGFIRCIEEAKNKAKEINGFLANQFSNKDNVLAHYETTGEEILKNIHEKIGGFVSGVGTGGTLMGTSERLKEKFSDMLTVAIEPNKMPLLSGGKALSQHKIEGIGDDFIPDLVDRDKIDKIILVNDDDAINMSRIISKELGIGIGISSGANFIGSVLLADEIEDKVVTVFADDNKKYLSTELSKDIDSNIEFVSNNIELLNYSVV